MSFSIDDSLEYALKHDAPSEIVRAFVEHRNRRNPHPFVKVVLHFLEEEFARKEFSEFFKARLSLIPDEPVPPDKLDFCLSLDSRFLCEPCGKLADYEVHFFGEDFVEVGTTTRICSASSLPCQSEIVTKHKVDVREAERADVFSFVVGKQSYDGCLSAKSWGYRVLDVRDGRFYLMNFTQCSRQDGEEMRQLVLRYEGGLPGFMGFRDGDELQLVQGLEDLAKAVACEDWGYRAELTFATEHDFLRLPSTQRP